MSHGFGALILPAPAPAADEAVGDPALDALALGVPVILAALLADAWAAVAPGELLFRTVRKHDPARWEFHEGHLPALFIYRADDGPVHETDGREGTEGTVNLLWVDAPAQPSQLTTREPFFNAWAKAWAWLVKHERHTSWVHEDDEESPAALAYGSNLPRHAGFERWWQPQEAVRRAVVEIPDGSGGAPRRYHAIHARVHVAESSVFDVAQLELAAAQVEFSLTTGGVDPLTTHTEVDPDEP